MYFKNNNIKLVYVYIAIYKYIDVLQKNESYCEKWIYFNV